MSRYAMTLGPRGRRAMGDVDLSTAVQNPEAVADELSRTWNPTGYYRPAEMNAAFDAIKKIQDYANAQIESVINPNGYTAISDADRSLLRDVQQRLGVAYAGTGTGLAYAPAIEMYRAIAQAQQAGRGYVDAPQFKRYVLNYLYKAAWAIDSAKRIASQLSWGQRFAQGLASFLIAAGNVVRQITGVTWEAIKAAGGVLVKVPDMLGTLVKVLAIGGVVVGGVWLHREYKKGI